MRPQPAPREASLYARFDVRTDRTQFAIPPMEALPLPFGFPANVWVLRGPIPALVDTGFVGGAEALVDGLASIGIAPADVGKILLTSSLPEAVGNVRLFENATVHAVGDASTTRLDIVQTAERIRTAFGATARELVAGDQGHDEWDEDEIELALDLYLHGVPAHVDVVPLADGALVRAGSADLTALQTPGVDAHAGGWFDAARNVLIGGATVWKGAPVYDPKAYTDSLARVSSLTPDEVWPAHGGVERSYTSVFRSLNLALSNLVQNMPFALDGPTPVAVIAYRDLGYWPRDLLRFAAHVWRYKVMLDELVASGVALREGTGAWATYSMTRPPRA